MSNRDKLIQVVSSMMKQETGRHLLDSGSVYGRKYEKLATVDLTQQPRATLDPVDGYSKSMFWHLIDTLDSISDLDDAYLKYDAEHTDESWFDTFENFCKERGIEVHNVENTYNGMYVIDGVMQVYQLEDADGWTHTAVMTHNGCDVRGGYSQARIFNGVWEEVVNVSDGTIFCDTCDNRWYTDDAYRWYNDEAPTYKGVTLGELFDEEEQCYKCTCGGKLTA